MKLSNKQKGWLMMLVPVLAFVAFMFWVVPGLMLFLLVMAIIGAALFGLAYLVFCGYQKLEKEYDW